VHLRRPWLWVAIALVTAPAAGGPLPTPPAGWKLDVIAAAPVVKHPSVVCCAPDGRVFVAEDPMDISLPSADAPQGRIVCLHPDGHVTTFAEKLHAVFGMQYLDGKLYVLHNPRFTVFRDDGSGVGKDPKDLIQSTNPNPWALNWNDHVPANFKLAMDGHFYVAVGDKGLYGATGTDGRRVDMRGGGVVRIRPDGSGLEIFCTGVRNILDVAVNDEDEIFTFDNTDEHDWMGRLTHMVDGGFYGYPYDFVPRRPYTLWMMADYGAGAATGTLCYNEDALPEGYRGNLFLADFGKRNILCVRVGREGATYKAVSRQDLFADVPPDFRPVGITLSPDGGAIYICDWQHVDTKETVQVGRLLKLTYTGSTNPLPNPAWYVPAASGQAFKASTQELLEGLSHSRHSVRMVAQRRLGERGSAVVPQLRALLADAKAPTVARRHALWALDVVDGGASSVEVLVRIAAGQVGADVALRRQVMRQLGLRRIAVATGALARAIESPDPSIRFHAATALGRIGDPAPLPGLMSALRDSDAWAWYATFTAVNRIGRRHSDAWEMITGGLRSDDERLGQGTAFAMRDTYDAALVAALAHTARDRKARGSGHEAGAVSALAPLLHKLPEWKGEWWAYHPALSPPPRKTEEWEATSMVMAVLRETLQGDNRAAIIPALDGLAECGDRSAAAAIRRVFRRGDPPLARAALKALAACDDGNSVEFLTGQLLNPGIVRYSHDRDDSLEPELLETLGRLRAPSATETVAIFAHSKSAEIRAAALAALVRIGGDTGSAAIGRLLEDHDPDVRRGAVAALGELGDRSALPKLLGAYSGRDTRDAAIGALAAMPDARAARAYVDGIAAPNFAVREKCRQALREVRDNALPALEPVAADLSDDALLELRQVYQDHATARRGPLFAREINRKHPEEYLSYALDHAGDARKGEKLFAAATAGGVGCATCHAVNGAGGTVGPDLSEIGAKYSRRDLAESVLYPSKAVREGYQQVIVRTKAGQTYAGPVKAQAPGLLVLQEADGTLRRIPTAEIEARKETALSPMPEGLHTGLSPEQFTDLVSYLESLKSSRTGM
jgi:putative membrane-bound dehydrogenase-like protein